MTVTVKPDYYDVRHHPSVEETESLSDRKVAADERRATEGYAAFLAAESASEARRWADVDDPFPVDDEAAEALADLCEEEAWLDATEAYYDWLGED